jgi:sporadic carbohydrate cluster protein (TIGR04323 family)
VSDRLGYRGYVTSRGFDGYVIPVPLQSLALRDYCTRNGMIYVLPVNENCFPHSYMVLEGMIQDLSAYEGVIMYSMRMLPQRADRRRGIYKKILDQGCSLHLVLEDLAVRSSKDIEKLEDLVLFDQLADRSVDQTIVIDNDR